MARGEPTPDILLLSLGTTLGWRVADALFLDQLAPRRRGHGRRCPVRIGASGRLRRAYPVTDLVEAAAARRALTRRRSTATRPRALVISTTTAAMLADTRGLPYAVRLDAPARLNRPGPQNAAPARARAPRSRPRPARAALEPRRPRRAARRAAPAIVVPPPVERSGEPPWKRERMAVAYTPDVKAKGLDVVCAAWAAARHRATRAWRCSGSTASRRSPTCAAPTRRCPTTSSSAARRRRESSAPRCGGRCVYVGGARWEDFGQAPLEALADGALLATVPSGGPFEALGLARELAPELVAGSVDAGRLAEALRAAFELPGGAARAPTASAPPRMLERFRPDAIQRIDRGRRCCRRCCAALSGAADRAFSTARSNASASASSGWRSVTARLPAARRSRSSGVAHQPAQRAAIAARSRGSTSSAFSPSTATSPAAPGPHRADQRQPGGGGLAHRHAERLVRAHQREHVGLARRARGSSPGAT